MIHVDFKDFEEMVSFAERLLGTRRAGANEGQTHIPAAQPVPVQPALEPASAPAVQAAPVQPVPVTVPVPQTAPVPVASVSYTADDLARAAMALMDSGRQAELIGLLKQFGVDSLPELKPEQYGPFATALRGMGAQI